MLVGVLSGSSLREYNELSGGAPVSVILPPTIWLSDPNERLDPELSRRLSESSTDNDGSLVATFDPVMFRNLYNPTTAISGLYAACLPEEGSAFDFRKRVGVLSPDPSFVPSFLVVHDAMRSRSSRLFFRSFVGALVKRHLTFTLFEADANNPDHKILFETYNAEVNSELASYSMFRGTGAGSILSA